MIHNTKKNTKNILKLNVSNLVLAIKDIRLIRLYLRWSIVALIKKSGTFISFKTESQI